MTTLDELIARGNTAAQAKQFESAEELFRKAVALYPEATIAQRNLGLVLAERHRFEEALPLLERLADGPIDLIHMLVLSDCLVDATRFSDARAWLERILAHHPDNAMVLNRMARLLDLIGDDAGALRFYKDAFARKPQNFKMLVDYVEALVEHDPAQAVPVLHEALARTNLNAENRCQLALLLADTTEVLGRQAHGLPIRRGLHSGDMDVKFSRTELHVAEEAARSWCEQSPTNGEAWHRHASIAISLGNIERAKEFYLTASKNGAEAVTEAAALRGSQSGSSPTDSMNHLGISPSLMQRPQEFRTDDIFFIACDAIYMRVFGVPWLRSINASSANGQVHIHLMDADTSFLSELTHILDSLPNVQVALSTQVLNRHDASRYERSCYYSNMRYVALGEMLQRYGKTLWLMDVDSLFNRDPRPAIKQGPDFDVAAIILPTALDPWNKVAAGMVIVRPTESGRRFTKAVAGHIMAGLRNRKLPFGLDQLALYAAVEELRDAGVAMNLLGLDEAIADLSDHADSCVWLQSGKRKIINTRYAGSDRPVSGIRQSRYVAKFREFSR